MRKIAVLVLLALAGCSVDAEVHGPTFVYHPQGQMLPFPSDRYLIASDDADPETEHATGYRVDVAAYESVDPALARFPGVADSIDDLDGFGTSAEIAIGFEVSPLLDERLSSEEEGFVASQEEDAPFLLTSIAPDDPDAGKPLPYVVRLETDGRTAFLRPWKPLRPSGWYAVVVRPGLQDAAGRGFRANEAFLADYKANAGQGLEGEGYKQLKSIDKKTPAFAFTFRTASITTKLETLLAEVRSLPPSAVTYTTRAPGAEHPDVALIVEGWFTHRNYRNAQGKLEDKLVSEEKLRFTMTLPKTTAEIHEPFPVALGQHGLGDKRQAVLRFANGFAKKGIATVAIDAPNHGSRGPGEGQSYDSLTGARQALGVWTDGENITFNAWQFRDIIRQQTLDHLQILKVVSSWQEDITRPTNESGPDIDGSKPVYTGQSMGGIMGGVTGAMLTELERVLLNVPGGRISNILVRNEVLGNAIVALMRPRTITMSDAYRMVAMVQSAIDSGDPINYVHRIALAPAEGSTARPLLIQASLQDATVPNFSTYDLARAAGTPLIGPLTNEIPGIEFLKLDAGGLSGNDIRAFAFFHDILVKGAPAIADHGNLWASDTAVEQAATFLKTGVIKP